VPVPALMQLFPRAGWGKEPTQKNLLPSLISHPNEFPTHVDIDGAGGNECLEHREDSQSLIKPNAGARSEWCVSFEGSLQTYELNLENM